MQNTLNQQNLAFARLLELSDLMLSDAIRGGWSSVVDLQVLRDGLIREFFAQPIELDSNTIGLGIKHILDCDKQLADAAEEEKKSLQKQIISMKQSECVERAYSRF